MKVTQKTIAERLDVSTGTVDRALNNRGRINEETKRKILSVAKELGYKPNNLARALVLNKTINIAAIFPKKPKYFVEKFVHGMLEAQSELTDYGVKVHFLHTDSMNPLEQEIILKNLDKENYNGIILDAGGDILRPYVDDLLDSNIPLITFDSDLNGSKRLFFIGQDSKKAGKIAGELMGEFLNGIGKVIMLTGFSSVFAHVERLDGFRSVINENYPNIELSDSHEYYDKEENAYLLVKKIMPSLDMVDGIYVTSAPGAIGVGRAIKEMKNGRRPKLIGFDVNEYVKDLLVQNVCTAVIYQDPYMQAYYSLKLLVRNILEDWLPKKQRLYIRSKIIIKNNVEDYVMEGKEDKVYPDLV